jgi:hypothetical protein
MTITYRGGASSFRTLGAAATPQNLLTIENTAGSAVAVWIRKIVVIVDETVALTTVTPQLKISRPASLPSGGTVLAKAPFDTGQSSAANVVIRGATASDGGVATAITSTLADVMWQQYIMRVHTAVGQILTPDLNVIPDICLTYPVILAANQALMLQIVASAGASNPATNFYIANIIWEENTP